MLCIWEGNHRPGITLAMHYSRLHWPYHTYAQSLRKGNKHLAHVPLGIWHAINQHTHTHTFNGPFFPGLPGWAGTKEVKPIWILLKQRDGEWQWYQLGYMQLCTSIQTDNHASTPPFSFLQAGCPSCCPTNSVKALKASHKPTLCQNSDGAIFYNRVIQ